MLIWHVQTEQSIKFPAVMTDFLKETLNISPPSLVIFVIITVKISLLKKNKPKSWEQWFPSMQSEYIQSQTQIKSRNKF